MVSSSEVAVVFAKIIYTLQELKTFDLPTTLIMEPLRLEMNTTELLINGLGWIG